MLQNSSGLVIGRNHKKIVGGSALVNIIVGDVFFRGDRELPRVHFALEVLSQDIMIVLFSAQRSWTKHYWSVFRKQFTDLSLPRV